MLNVSYVAPQATALLRTFETLNQTHRSIQSLLEPTEKSAGGGSIHIQICTRRSDLSQIKALGQSMIDCPAYKSLLGSASNSSEDRGLCRRCVLHSVHHYIAQRAREIDARDRAEVHSVSQPSVRASDFLR